MDKSLKIIGGGMAGCEAAWQAANMGIQVTLYEMRPKVKTFAHQTEKLGEMVCSNSFRSNDHEQNAVGLLHWEMMRANGLVISTAYEHKLPAGGALAVDRDEFANSITNKLKSHPNIKISLFCMSINLILNLILIREFLHVGLAISTSVSAWINFILLFYILNKNLNYYFDISIFKVFLKVSLASLTMSYIVLKTYEFMINNFEMYTFYNTNFILILCIIFGIIIYSTLMYFLGIKELEINKWKIQKK